MKDTQEKETIISNHEEHVDVIADRGPFGDPNIQPVRHRCPIHGPIASSRIDWQGGTKPHCPDCGKVLETEANGLV